ncbi:MULTISPECIES: hypothetical protein [Paraburkholderia]|uniref:Uncharacterized protein n=1 Tax=Paraburkholderia dioscoreae TaxID=2604047 RepID=A0A5Q4Z2X3_9BURK|nr:MULTISPECIES: hypothetical protein [Paraburkholderia]MDR8400521.1 hypothetical protein [Paraburkholderia sp. USG1]VVD31554.1 protein of unknown function [Paraburkholderia dioscoreae]
MFHDATECLDGNCFPCVTLTSAAQLVDSGEHPERRAWISRLDCSIGLFQDIRDLLGTGRLLITATKKMTVNADSRKRRTECIEAPKNYRRRAE